MPEDITSEINKKEFSTVRNIKEITGGIHKKNEMMPHKYDISIVRKVIMAFVDAGKKKGNLLLASIDLEILLHYTMFLQLRYIRI